VLTCGTNAPQSTTRRAKYKAVKYWRIHRNLADLRACLVSGYPFVFSFSAHVRFKFEVRTMGTLDMPAKEEGLLGKHAVAVGYNDKSHRFIVGNSWGPTFGLRGYFTMPYGYMTDDNLTPDFWTVQVVTYPDLTT
jgi:C1A family cysteine protease